MRRPAVAGATFRWPMVLAILLSASAATAADNVLLAAAERGDRAAALTLLAKGANPNTPGPDGTTADHVGGRQRRSRTGARAHRRQGERHR